jgi:hypothetical protein
LLDQSVIGDLNRCFLRLVILASFRMDFPDYLVRYATKPWTRIPCRPVATSEASRPNASDGFLRLFHPMAKCISRSLMSTGFISQFSRVNCPLSNVDGNEFSR